MFRVLGSDDNFDKDKFYCTGPNAVGNLEIDFLTTEDAENAAEYLKERYPDTDYKVIEEDTILTKAYVDSLWYNPEFIHLREAEDSWTDKLDYEENWGIR